VADDECRIEPLTRGRDDARVELGPLGGIGGDLERLREERDRLLVRAEGGRSLGRPPERDAGLGRERIGLGRISGQPLRREVVPGEPARELVRAEVLEVARRREVADLPVPLRERVVRDLPDEGLDEGVLAALGGAKLCPRTAAPATRSRSAGSSPSRRAAMSAVRVSGTATSSSVPTGRYDPPSSTRRPCARSIRTVSTAYSGTPSARATMLATAFAGRPGTRPASSRSISAGGSGSR